MRNFDIFGTQEIIQKKLPIAFTFGNFDGVHLGHQFLFSKMRSKFPEPIVVMLFDPHPANFFKPQEPKKFLTTLEDKINLLQQCGVDAVVVQKFTTDFSLLTADEFCEWMIKHFNVRHVFFGYNLLYGKNRLGNFFHMQNFAKKSDISISQSPAFEDAPAKIVSSTRIRSALMNAELPIAEKLLGRPYFISGVVIHGDSRGRVIGFPTANINFNDSLVIPHFGVYACEVELVHKYPNKRFFGVLNCGLRPSINTNTQKIHLEVYIIDFNEDIYGEKIIFHFKHFIRNEQRFGNLSHLKEQIYKDIDIALKYLKPSTSI